MKYLYTIFILSASLLSCNNKTQEQQKSEVKDSIVNIVETPSDEEFIDDVSDYLNLSDTTVIRVIPDEETKENRPKLRLEPISKHEYYSIDSTYTKKSSLLAQNTDSTFALHIKNETWSFKKEPNMEYGKTRAGKHWGEYIGYYPDIKLHAIRSCSVSGDLHGFASLFWIDKETGNRYCFLSDGDYCHGTPILSPNNKYMAIVDTGFDDAIGYVEYIVVIKINERNNPTEFLSYFNESKYRDLKFDQIIWINDNELVVKGYTQEWTDHKHILEYSYYKVYLQSSEHN